MWKSGAQGTKLLESEALRRMCDNTDYLMELKAENLLFPFRWQAGLTGTINHKIPTLHGGWDAQTSHIRGTFTGHWLSAAAHTVAEQPNGELLARANYIVDELGKVQQANGGKWVFPIPEDYIYGVREGKGYWAPLYVCHKVLMGLFDMHVLAGNAAAMKIIEQAAAWFEEFAAETDENTLVEMMDLQETGGFMELWADLYGFTKDERYLILMKRFERRPLFDGLLQGKDVLSNMHANSTIPEAHGAARAYEVTGEERYRKIAEAYWRCAVDDRGTFATGGQTSGEVWTPMNRQAARLGDTNQEYCTVYNMIRLAEYLYRWTGHGCYADYIERNIINGLYAQGYYMARAIEGLGDNMVPEKKLVAYYLPLKAGAVKQWATHTETFWCCVCTLVQANSRMREWIFHQKENTVSVDQFIPAVFKTSVGETPVTLEQRFTDLGGSCNRINDIANSATQRPRFQSMELHIKTEAPVSFALRIRVPWWINGDMVCYLDGKELDCTEYGGYVTIERQWSNCCLRFDMPKNIRVWNLPDEPETFAFLDGPTVLAGLVGEERMLYGDAAFPESFIKPADERLWGSWTETYKTFNQPVGFSLVPLKQIGDEPYTVYFPVRKSETR